jgi:hypothetical protein
MNPSFLPELQSYVNDERIIAYQNDGYVSSEIDHILDREVFIPLKQKSSTFGKIPVVIFPIQLNDTFWLTAVLLRALEEDVSHFVIIDINGKANDAPYLDVMKIFAQKMDALYRTGPKSSLKIHHVKPIMNCSSNDAGLLAMVILRELVSMRSSHWSLTDDVLQSKEGITETTVHGTDYVADTKLLRQLISGESQPANLLSSLRSQSNSVSFSCQLETQYSFGYADNFDGNRLIFSEEFKNEVDELGVSEEFRSMFVNDVSFEDFLEARKKGITYGQMTDWNYDFITQYQSAIPMNTSDPGPPSFERLDIKKRDYLDFIANHTKIDRKEIDRKLTNMACCRRLDRKLVDLRYNYLRSITNHSLILKAKTVPTKGAKPRKRKIDDFLIDQQQSKVFKRTIHPHDLIYYSYYAHSHLGNHGSVRVSFDAVKNEIDNLTRDMVWFMCNRCKNCEAKSKDQRGSSLVHAEKPLQRLQVDLIDMTMHPSKVGDHEFKWILALRDDYSQFVSLFALKDKKISTVREQLEQALLRTTFPEDIQSGNGTEFLNTFFGEILTDVNIIPLTTPIEPLEVTLTNQLTTYMNENRDPNWSGYLARICHTINHSLNKQVNAIPSSVLFSRMAVNLEKRRFQVGRLNEEAIAANVLSNELWPDWQASMYCHEVIPDPE